MVKLLILALFLCSPASFAGPLFKAKNLPISGTSTPAMKKYDKKFLLLMKKWNIPGGEVAIMKDGKLVYNRGFGYADIKTRQAVTPTNLFRIASVSKAITAMTVMRLIQDNKLSLNDKAFYLLSDLKPLPGYKANRDIGRISVKNLLQMSSGWFSRGKYRFDPMFGPWPSFVKKMYGKPFPTSCQDTVRLMMSMKIRSKPGSSYSYSNLDYCLLGLIIDKATGHGYGYQGYEQTVQQVLLQPLGITDMSIGNSLQAKSKPNEVHYYRYLGPVDISHQGRSTYLPYGDDQILQKNFANGGWIATASDLAKITDALSRNKILTPFYTKLLLAPPRHARYKFLKPSKGKKRKTRKTSFSYYAMGWKVVYRKRRQSWYATGSFTGTNAMVIHTSDGLSIAAVFNARPPMHHLFRQIRPQIRRMFIADNSNTLMDFMDESDYHFGLG